MITFFLVLFVAEGLLLAGLAVPLILRRIGPNPIYGFRVRQTLDDTAVWYAVNAYAAWCLLAVGLGIAVTAIALYLVPEIDFVVYACAVGAVAVGGLAVSLFLSLRYLHSLPSRSASH